MRITESRLRSVIRSVIRESYDEDFPSRDASQRRETHKYLDQPHMSDDDFDHAENAASTLVDYCNQLPSRSQDGEMDKILLKNLVHRAFSSRLDREELQKKLVEILDSNDILGYDRYIGNVVFWREVHDRFSEII